MKRGRPWTYPEQRKLEDMWNEGFAVAHIASTLQRNENTIRRRVTEMKLGARSNKNRIAVILDYETLSRINAIASHRNISVNEMVTIWIKDRLVQRMTKR